MQIETLALENGGTLTVYLRSACAEMPHFCRRPLVLVVPGGGYAFCSAREADPVALQFAAAGYHTAVLEYAVGPNARYYTPLRQLSAAMEFLRQNAEQWNIFPDKIALCGFSAGGHLALSGAVLDLPTAEERAHQQRPNALVLAYPVVTAGEYAHRGSFDTLTGTTDLAVHKQFSLEDKVTPATPPVFVWHTMADNSVPVENSLLLLSALRKAHVPCEAHFFEHGAHGGSISTQEVDTPDAHRAQWTKLAIEWLNETFDFYANK